MQVFLETQRPLLRRFTVADADDLMSLDADPDDAKLTMSRRRCLALRRRLPAYE